MVFFGCSNMTRYLKISGRVSCLAVILWLLLMPRTGLAQPWYRVTGVYDGDTIVLEDGRCVRYIGINTPETAHPPKVAEPFGNEARKANQALVYRKKVRLEFDHERFDRYGRHLAYVFLENDTFVNLSLIEKGVAYCLPRYPNLRFARVFLTTQRRAMTAARGIWRDWPRPPKREKLVGNRRSRRFHRSTCPYGRKTGERHRQVFSNRWDAFWAGFAPCRQCIKTLRD